MRIFKKIIIISEIGENKNKIILYCRFQAWRIKKQMSRSAED